MLKLNLSQGKVALIDDCDAHLEAFKWYYNSRGYVVRNASMEGGKRRMLLLHREILGASEGLQVDHINGDKLDNRRDNLRLCTSSQNNHNARMKSNNTSGVIGVSWFNPRNTWRARVCINNQDKTLGYFENKADAMLSVDRAKRELHGEFARTNTRIVDGRIVLPYHMIQSFIGS